MVTQAAKRMQKTIEEAYLDLLEKESFRAVTVTQIAQAALINRQTFYHHYQDKYDLTDRMTAAVFIRVRELIDVRLAQLKRGESVDDFFSFLINISRKSRDFSHGMDRPLLSSFMGLFVCFCIFLVIDIFLDNFFAHIAQCTHIVTRRPKMTAPILATSYFWMIL